MPLYEYQCLDCQDLFQKRRAFAEANEPLACPACASMRTRKTIGAVMMLTGASSPSSARPSDLPASGPTCCGGHCGCSH
jgi:putative FmdB family regulatory protein